MIMDEDDLKRYLAEARSFDFDLRLRADHSRRIAWIIAGVSTTVAVAAVTAVAMLAPLKTVEPFVIRVDSATGVPEVMTSLSDGKEDYGEAVAKYFLARYVRTREGYNYAAREAIYREVQVLSARDEQAEFSAFYNASNPDSPQFIYGKNVKAEIAVRSIAFIGEDLAQIRYSKSVTERDETVRTLWVATVQFSFRSGAVISDQDRLINSLGFVVTDYRADPEAIE